MNKIYIENGTYKCLTESGEVLIAKRWYEKKTDKFYIQLPKDNETGREYISENKLDANGEYFFETKTTGPRTLGNWRALLTAEELAEYETCEKRMSELEALGKSRKPEKADLTTEEGIAKEIERLLKLRETLKK